MEEKEALMTATFFSCRYGRIPVSVLSARLLWQYDSTASTVPTGTLQQQAQPHQKLGCHARHIEPQVMPVTLEGRGHRQAAVLPCGKVLSACKTSKVCKTPTGRGHTSRCPAAAL